MLARVGLLCSSFVALHASADVGGSLIGRLHSPLVAAHRGGEFGQPNTLVQFANAMQTDDAEILEMDLRLTSDGKVVVFHDPTLDQKSECTGTVEASTYARLLRCKLTNGERIALFADVLTLVDGKKIISAEFKTDSVIGPAADLVLAAHAAGWTYFQVGSSRARYQSVRSRSSELAVMAKADSGAALDWILAANDPLLKIVELNRDAVNTALLQQLHAHGKLVSLNTWRYQFTEERFIASCDRAFGQGIDIAVTNNPASCRRQARLPLSHGVDAGYVIDRQHIRTWGRSHPGLVRVLGAALASLMLGFLVTGTLRASKRYFRWSRARTVRWPDARVHALAGDTKPITFI